MSVRHASKLRSLVFHLLALSLGACAVAAADTGEPPPALETAALRSPDAAATTVLHYEISQVLWRCYAAGADLVGAGDVQGAKATLRRCFAPDMEFEAVMPPAYAALGFSTTGPDGFVDFADQFYRSLQFTRTQHTLSNLVVDRTGPNTVTATSAGLATHVFPDEHVLNATVRFDDELERIHGEWMFVHRTMTVTSLTQAAAWTP